jgi:hypothetical protein
MAQSTTYDKFIYFPSLSSGASKSWLQKDVEIAPGISSRFYSDTYPEEWRHKYFLITAGHHYKKMDFRQRMGLDPSVQVMGDSGGFQLATGAIQWDPSFKETIFNWLEENSDIAMNLDLPPRVTLQGKFNECLDISLENFKYFETHQSGKTAYLTVLQGDNEQEYNYWYNKVKDFNFRGWAFGNCRNVTNLMYSLALMIKNKEFLKPNNNYLHILGASKLYDFFLYEYLQMCLNDYTGGKVQVSTDSSSPALMTVYGGYYFDADYKYGGFVTAYMERNMNFNENGELPCKLVNCPACAGRTYKDIIEWKTSSYMYMTNHNMHIFLDTIRTIKRLQQSHFDLMESLVDPVAVNICKAMKEMFESNDPIQVYEKYKPVYSKFNNMFGMREFGYKKTTGNPDGKPEAINSHFDFN